MRYFFRKKVVITGGSSGIGLAAAKQLAMNGADLCIIARHIPRLEAARQTIKQLCIEPDQQVIGMPVDITKPTHIRKCAEKVMEMWDRIDCLINNAGISYPGYIHELPDHVWYRLIDNNYLGTVNTTLAFLPFFMKQKFGHIANIASVLGFMGIFGCGAYTASKFAVVGFSECLRQDLIPYNIAISVFYPPDTDTPLLHQENRIKPEETRILSGNIKILPADKTAVALLKGLQRKQYTIIPGFLTNLTYFLNRHMPGILRSFLDRELREFYRKQNRFASGQGLHSLG
jgi:3-dehydrosphinganine reductase